MSTCTYNCLMNVINIGNSIIGVSILAMPYCFRKCGILLSIILIFISGLLTRLACYLLLKSAIMARRRNYEFLAFHIFGSTGKLAVEISVIGFLIGVCIAFFVVIGDLGPPLAAEFLMINNSSNLRTNVLMLVGLCVALPLGMLRKIDSLTSLSALSIAFYICLILKIFAEAVPILAANEWWYEVNWWNSDGILPCLPIFSMALSCQTQLFEFFDTLSDPSLKRMQSAINGAVYLCSTVYMLVGILGYVAFHDKMITGNILVFLTPSMVTEIIKLGFIITVAISFPLCLFPCRSSLHSLLFKQGFGHSDLNVSVIPELRFRVLTVSLVIVTIGIAIMLPNIEFVLGIIGSTIGSLICLIFPAVMFIHDSSKNSSEKRMAQILISIGSFILIACTYSTLHEANVPHEPIVNQIQKVINHTPQHQVSSMFSTMENHLPSVSILNDNILKLEEKPPEAKIPMEQKRLEPPIPQEPDAKLIHLKENEEVKIKIAAEPEEKISVPIDKENANILQKTEIKHEINGDLDPQALQKEDKEIQKESVRNLPTSMSVDVSKKDKNIEKQEKLLQKLEEQHQEQRLILEEQKKVLEALKLHKETHEEKDNNKNVKLLNVVPNLKSSLNNINKDMERKEQFVLKVNDAGNTHEKLNLNKMSKYRSPDNIKYSTSVIKGLDISQNNSQVLSNKKKVINLNNVDTDKSERTFENLVKHQDVKDVSNNILLQNKTYNEEVKLQNANKNNSINQANILNLPQINPPNPLETKESELVLSDAHINKREPLATYSENINVNVAITNSNTNVSALLPDQEKVPI